MSRCRNVSFSEKEILKSPYLAQIYNARTKTESNLVVSSSPPILYMSNLCHICIYIFVWHYHCVSILTMVDAEHSSHSEGKIEWSIASALRWKWMVNWRWSGITNTAVRGCGGLKYSDSYPANGSRQLSDSDVAAEIWQDVNKALVCVLFAMSFSNGARFPEHLNSERELHQ